MYPFRFLGIQFSASDRDAAFSRRAGLSALQPSRRTGRRSCCVCARKDRKDQRRFHGGEAYNTLRQTFVLIGTTPRVTGNSAVKPLGTPIVWPFPIIACWPSSKSA